jgi:hypothetical protein
MWVANSKAKGAGLSKPWSSHHETTAQMLDMELQELMFVLLDFSLALLRSFLAILLFLPYGMGMFTLCQHIVEVCNLLSDFCRDSELRIALNLRGEFGLLNNVGTVKTMGTPGDGMNACSIMRWTCAF